MSDTTTCYKCNGSGVIPEFRHIDNGTCYHCEGTGKAARKPDAAARKCGRWSFLCSGVAEGVAMTVWADADGIKVDMVVDDADRNTADARLCAVYASRADWRRRKLTVTHKSMGYSAAVFGDALDALRAKLAAA